MKLNKILTFIFCLGLIFSINTSNASAQSVHGFFYWYGTQSGYYGNDGVWSSWNTSTPERPEGVYNDNCTRIDEISNGWTITSLYWSDSAAWYNSAYSRWERAVGVQYYKADPVVTPPPTPPTPTTVNVSLSNAQFNSTSLEAGSSYNASVRTNNASSAVYWVNYKIEYNNGSSWSNLTTGSKQTTGPSETLYTDNFTVPDNATEVRLTWTIQSSQYLSISNGTQTLTANVNSAVPSMPTVSPKGGTYDEMQVIILRSPNGGKIYYTTDGNTPRAVSTDLYSESFYIDKDTTLKAIAVVNGVSSRVMTETYYINGVPSLPTFSPNGGTVPRGTEVTIRSNIDGAIIKYTTDGTEPFWSYGSAKTYTGPIIIYNNVTIRARAYTAGGSNRSEVMGAIFTVVDDSNNNPIELSTPYVSPYAPANGKVFYGTQTVSIYSDDAATIYYTTDGSMPTRGASGTQVYSRPITIDAPTTVKARTYRDGAYSPLMEAKYIVVIEDQTPNRPTSNVSSGTYTSSKRVYLYGDEGNIIRYTTDGSEPDKYSDILDDGDYINVTKTTTVKAKAFKNGLSSDTLTIRITIDVPVYAYEDENELTDEAKDLLSLAWAKYNAKQYDACISILEELMAEYDDCQEGIVLMANSYVNKKQVNTAKSLLRDFIDEYEYPLAVNRYAELIADAGQNTEAKRMLINTIENYPSKDYLYRTLTFINSKLGNTDIKVFIKGTEVNFAAYDDVKPMIENGFVLIPIRAFAETLGADVEWDDYSKEATVTYNGKTILLRENNVWADVDGEDVEMVVPTRKLNGRVLIPLRFVIENFENQVDWFQVGMSRTAVVY